MIHFTLACPINLYQTNHPAKSYDENIHIAHQRVMLMDSENHTNILKQSLTGRDMGAFRGQTELFKWLGGHLMADTSKWDTGANPQETPNTENKRAARHFNSLRRDGQGTIIGENTQKTSVKCGLTVKELNETEVICKYHTYFSLRTRQLVEIWLPIATVLSFNRLTAHRAMKTLSFSNSDRPKLSRDPM